jgi:hypothetical protein
MLFWGFCMPEPPSSCNHSALPALFVVQLFDFLGYGNHNYLQAATVLPTWQTVLTACLTQN